VALGVSAIGKHRPDPTARTTVPSKITTIVSSGNELPIMRGMELTADDLLRRAVIQMLMCHFTLSKEAWKYSI